ncbi:MAG TPA: hypothetical protein PK859_14770 [Spirochaetota bacterium]|nr:hypothetical protein [Spirochaetota bacterium]
MISESTNTGSYNFFKLTAAPFHTLDLVEIDAGKTKLVQKEDFSGILVPFFNFDSTVSGFTMMNEALRKRVENRLR